MGGCAAPWARGAHPPSFSRGRRRFKQEAAAGAIGRHCETGRKGPVETKGGRFLWRRPARGLGKTDRLDGSRGTTCAQTGMPPSWREARQGRGQETGKEGVQSAQGPENMAGGSDRICRQRVQDDICRPTMAQAAPPAGKGQDTGQGLKLRMKNDLR